MGADRDSIVYVITNIIRVGPYGSFALLTLSFYPTANVNGELYVFLQFCPNN